jgi:hypothetical protein
VFEIGISLREARLRQGIELSEAEQGTKIRSKYLRALEDERFELLPAHPYVKGFLRSYADFLGLDGQLYVDEYNSRYVPGEEEPLVQTRRRPPSRGERRVESRVVLLALAGIAGATALVIAAWNSTPEQPQIPNLGTTPAAAPPAVQDEGRPATVTPKRRAQPAVARLVVVASRGPCWIEVRTGSPRGRMVFRDTLALGERYVGRHRRLYLAAGAPANIDVRVNGKRQVVPSTSGLQLLVTSRGLAAA